MVSDECSKAHDNALCRVFSNLLYPAGCREARFKRKLRFLRGKLDFFFPLSIDTELTSCQLVILNGISIAGRVAPGIFARFIPVPILTIICTFACAALIYSMSGITTVAAFVVFGILFGFFCGACKCFIYFFPTLGTVIDWGLSYRTYGTINCHLCS
jgi:hypothetical protein